MKPGKSGLARIIDATGYSISGIKAAYSGEAAFRQELLLALILGAASFWLARTVTEWLLLILPVFVLLIVELLNSAIESVVDRVGDDFHELSGRAKDMGSAAVLIALIIAALVWASVLIEQPPSIF